VTHLVLATAPPKSTDELTKRALLRAADKGLSICSWSFVNALQKAADPPTDRPSPPARTTNTDDEKAHKRQRYEYHAGTDERWWGLALLEKDWHVNWPVERAYVPEGVAALIDAPGEDDELGGGGGDDNDEVMIIRDDVQGGELDGRRQVQEVVAVDIDPPQPVVDATANRVSPVTEAGSRFAPSHDVCVCVC
jgi:hypothetical protein